MKTKTSHGFTGSGMKTQILDETRRRCGVHAPCTPERGAAGVLPPVSRAARPCVEPPPSGLGNSTVQPGTQTVSSKVDFTGRRIHFIGSGGIGVSALMELCRDRGALVTGCDSGCGGQVESLRAKGYPVETTHSPAHVAACDEVVHTAALDGMHPEVLAARITGKAISTRMHMLGQIARGTRAICITGTHGKTTTTWLIANLLLQAERDPSILVGGVVKALGGNARCGQGAEFVAEVDESDNRLHEVVPTLPVITNIDYDHLENYGGSIDALEMAMERFLRSVDTSDPCAALLGCGDDLRVRRALQRAGRASGRPVFAYGHGPACDVTFQRLRPLPCASETTGRPPASEPSSLGWVFDAHGPFGVWRDIELPMPGKHNVLNALAALTAGWRLGVPADCIREALAHTERVGRRFEIKGVKRGVRVVDDYGHHPTEIAATLQAARDTTQGRLAVLFQPHRYTRTAKLLQEFASCFAAADLVCLLPIYAASEKPIAGVTHKALAKAIAERGQQVLAFDTRPDAVAHLLGWACENDTVVTQGAGDVTRASDELVSGL